MPVSVSKSIFLFDPIGEYLRPRLQGFRLVNGVYSAMTWRQADRLSSGELKLDLAVDGHLLRVIDPKTRRRLPTGEEYQEQLKSAWREARQAKRAAAEAERRTAELKAEIARLRRRLPPDHAS